MPATHCANDFSSKVIPIDRPNFVSAGWKLIIHIAREQNIENFLRSGSMRDINLIECILGRFSGRTSILGIIVGRDFAESIRVRGGGRFAEGKSVQHSIVVVVLCFLLFTPPRAAEATILGADIA